MSGNESGSGRGEAPVQMQIRFERFPASLKGAFVLRGADGDPHAVAFDWARVARIPSGATRPVILVDRQLDVAPNRDLFVPFEVAVAEMDPSWYMVESSLRVDGGRSYPYSGRPFTIPWPRSDVRKASLQVVSSLSVEGQSFHVGRVELGWDSASVLWRLPERGRLEGRAATAKEDEGISGSSGGEARAVLIADGTELEPIPEEAGPRLTEPRAEDERRSVTYPMMRSSRSLHLVMELASGRRGEPIALDLP